MSAKPTQFSFPVCHSFPAVASKSYIATNYALNSDLTVHHFNQGLYLMCQGANELNALTGISMNAFI